MSIKRYFNNGTVYYTGSERDNELVDYYNEGHNLVDCAAKFTDCKLTRVKWTLLQASEVRYVRNFTERYPIIYGHKFERIYGVRDRQYKVP